jgi:hypothetical protein
VTQVTVIWKAPNSGVRTHSVCFMKRKILLANPSPSRLISRRDEAVVCDCADDVTTTNPDYTVCSVCDDVGNSGDGSGRETSPGASNTNLTVWPTLKLDVSMRRDYIGGLIGVQYRSARPLHWRKKHA